MVGHLTLALVIAALQRPVSAACSSYYHGSLFLKTCHFFQNRTHKNPSWYLPSSNCPGFLNVKKLQSFKLTYVSNRVNLGVLSLGASRGSSVESLPPTLKARGWVPICLEIKPGLLQPQVKRVKVWGTKMVVSVVSVMGMSRGFLSVSKFS